MDKRDFLKKGLIGGMGLAIIASSTKAESTPDAYKGWTITWSGWSYLQGTSYEVGVWIAKNPNSLLVCWACAGDSDYPSRPKREGIGPIGSVFAWDAGFYGFADQKMRENAVAEAYGRILKSIDKVESGKFKYGNQ